MKRIYCLLTSAFILASSANVPAWGDTYDEAWSKHRKAEGALKQLGLKIQNGFFFSGNRNEITAQWEASPILKEGRFEKEALSSALRDYAQAAQELTQRHLEMWDSGYWRKGDGFSQLISQRLNERLAKMCIKALESPSLTDITLGIVNKEIKAVYPDCSLENNPWHWPVCSENLVTWSEGYR